MNIEDDLASRIEGSAARGQANGYTAYALVAIGVLASASATISVAAGALTPTANAVLAALPGIVVMVLRSLKFEQRSKWWLGKTSWSYETSGATKVGWFER